MSKTDTLEKPITPAEEQHITEETMVKILEAKFGKELMADNYTVLPNRIVDKFHAIKITPIEFTFWVTIIRFQYGTTPAWPSIGRIAETMGRHERSVMRYIKRMEEKGMLTVIRGEPNDYGVTTNQYDFTPMYDKIIALYPYTETHLLDNNENGKNGKQPEKPNHKKGSDMLSPPNNKNVSGNTTKMLTRVPKNPAEVSPKEDESEEEESLRSNDSNLRSKTEKGTGLNGSSTNEQADSNKAKQNGSSTKNNQVSNNKRKPKTGTLSAEETPAPPACTNVQPNSDTPPPPLPMYAASVIDGISRQFHDQAPKSSQTIAARMYQEIARWRGDEYTFGELAGYAKDDANKANIKKRNPDGSINRMPYFFTMLRKVIEHNIALWAKEEEERRRAEAEGQNEEGNAP